MGIFDFIKDVGSNILGKGNEDKKIKELLNKELGDRITDLEVEFKDSTVYLSGTCDSQATREKGILLAGNIKGVESVNDENFTAPAAEEEVEFYTVQRGDSLSKIAKRYYGNAMKYPEIFEANREVIKDPDLIYPGQKLRIPKLQ